jgi:hypothetical protein
VARELQCYRPSDSDRDAWLARVNELIDLISADPAWQIQPGASPMLRWVLQPARVPTASCIYATAILAAPWPYGQLVPMAFKEPAPRLVNEPPFPRGGISASSSSPTSLRPTISPPPRMTSGLLLSGPTRPYASTSSVSASTMLSFPFNGLQDQKDAYTNSKLVAKSL